MNRVRNLDIDLLGAFVAGPGGLPPGLATLERRERLSDLRDTGIAPLSTRKLSPPAHGAARRLIYPAIETAPAKQLPMVTIFDPGGIEKRGWRIGL